MSLRLYIDETFNIGSEVDLVNTFVGNGVQVNFILTVSSTARLASTIQAESTQYLQFTGGFTKDSGTNSFTLNSAPPPGSQIVAPGLNAITATVFDQEVVEGVDDPRIAIVNFCLGDGDEIHLYKWNSAPAYDGIRLTVVDVISAVGASTTWCQLATAKLDGTYEWLDAEEALEVGPITAGGTMTSSILAGSTGIIVDVPTQFAPTVGGYIKLAPGTPSEEIRIVTSVNTSTGLVTLSTPTDFAHLSGQFAFHIGWPIAIKVEVPEDVTGNTANNFFDLAVRVEARGSAR